jgi:cytochrome d ubiquinol oxidase subunit I
MRWLLWIYVFTVLGAYAANHAGWVSAEVGRQPWIVYPSTQDGVYMDGLRTSEGLSESVTANQVLWSIIMFGLIYGMLFFIWIYVLNSKIQKGPVEGASIPDREHRDLVSAAAALAGENRSLLDADEGREAERGERS